MKRILVSACLAGTPVRYDGKPATLNHKIMVRWISEGRAVMACPEVIGGLSTPRSPAEIVGGDGDDVLDGQATVQTRDGVDVTEQFVSGAKLALQVAQKHDIQVALLQDRAPSCGGDGVYDGTFSRTMRDGRGVTAALFERNGIKVFGGAEIEAADEYVTGLK